MKELFILDQDIPVFYVTAESYPEGILAAHQKLHAMVPFTNDRNYFGLSRPENNEGKIVYRAAAQELEEGEGAKHHCDTLVIRKGKYTAITLLNFIEDPERIETAFRELLQDPDIIDPQGYCVEWYLSDRDVRCMIRLNN